MQLQELMELQPSCKECFHILGDSITEVAKSVFEGVQPTPSQRTWPGQRRSLCCWYEERRLWTGR